MKLFRKVIFIAALSALATASQAQIVIHWLPILTNYVSNPGFESGYSNWDRSQSYHEGDEIEYLNLGEVTNDAHSGGHGMDMELGYSYGYNGYYHFEMKQKLASTVAVNSLWSASCWCQSDGNYVDVQITYTDNTTSYGSYSVDSYDATAGNNGFVQINFMPQLKSGKTIKSIDISADSFEGGDMVIDDIELDTLTWYYIG